MHTVVSFALIGRSENNETMGERIIKVNVTSVCKIDFKVEFKEKNFTL